MYSHRWNIYYFGEVRYALYMRTPLSNVRFGNCTSAVNNERVARSELTARMSIGYDCVDVQTLDCHWSEDYPRNVAPTTLKLPILCNYGDLRRGREPLQNATYAQPQKYR